MKIFYTILLFTVLILSGCSKYVPEKIEQNPTENLHIVKFINDFLATHENFNNNDITRQKADMDFFQSFSNLSDSINVIEGIPLKLVMINETSNGDFIAQFRSWQEPSAFSYPYPIESVNFDLVGKIDSLYAYSLTDNSYYTISGKFIRRFVDLTSMEYFLGRGTTAWSNKFQIREPINLNDVYEVYLGLLEYEIYSIIPYQN